MFALIKRRWQTIANDLAGTPLYWRKTASSLLFRNRISTAIGQFARGKVIDLGAGAMNYKDMIEKTGATYHSLDYAPTETKYQKDIQLDYVGDIQNLPIEDSQFDTVFCSQVLEHISEPQRAVNEMSRIIKIGGYAIISTPHLAYLHNEPYDFYRYTKYGLKHLVEKAGLHVVDIQPIGGLFCFLNYISSTMFLSIFYKIPLLWPIAFGVNLLVSYLCIGLDGAFRTTKILPLNYLLIARK